MSRIGTQPIIIPETVTLKLQGDTVVVSSKQAELKQLIPPGIKLEIKDNQVQVSPLAKTKQTKALHGLIRSLINNMIIGVTEGYQKTLELQGTGFRVVKKGQDLELSLGYSHPINFTAPEGISFEVEGNNIIKITGADKQKLGQLAADIRASRPPDAYKGKGVRYQDELVRLKPGKSAKAAGTGGAE